MSYLGLWSCIGTNVKLGRLEGLNKKGRFLSPSTSLDTIVTVEIETLSKPSHFYFWQSKRSCCTCKAPRGSTWRWDRALQRADEGHNSNYGTTVYTECGDGAEGVFTSGWESRGRKEVLDKEEIGQELELLHFLEGEQKCCRGKVFGGDKDTLLTK